MKESDHVDEAIEALKAHAESNAQTAAAIGKLIDAMREQHVDMQEQHRDLQEQHADNDAINRTMMWATVVMTVATVVMAWKAVS